MVVVFDYAVNQIARKSTTADYIVNAAILQPTKSAFSGGPDRTVGIKKKMVNVAHAQPIGGCVRCARLTMSEICDAPVDKAKPDAAPQGIGRKRPSIILMSQPAPRNSFELASR